MPGDTIWWQISVNIGWGNGLLNYGFKPLPELKLTVIIGKVQTFAWEEVHYRYLNHQSLKLAWKLLIWKKKSWGSYSSYKFKVSILFDSWYVSTCPLHSDICMFTDLWWNPFTVSLHMFVLSQSPSSCWFVKCVCWCFAHLSPGKPTCHNVPLQALPGLRIWRMETGPSEI